VVQHIDLCLTPELMQLLIEYRFNGICRPRGRLALARMLGERVEARACSTDRGMIAKTRFPSSLLVGLHAANT